MTAKPSPIQQNPADQEDAEHRPHLSDQKPHKVPAHRVDPDDEPQPPAADTVAP
ncbi:hypothetical protein GCM10009760_54510 [Kitasatospora kazusensis]|uniref:Uncharacterized protein n=1 Tax=Kitasatospora kazusensis TaxID=407974 RepID=A0ABP5LVW2_9ACTN